MRLHLLDRETESSQSRGRAGEGEAYFPLSREPETTVIAKTLKSCVDLKGASELIDTSWGPTVDF